MLREGTLYEHEERMKIKTFQKWQVCERKVMEKDHLWTHTLEDGQEMSKNGAPTIAWLENELPMVMHFED